MEKMNLWWPVLVAAALIVLSAGGCAARCDGGDDQPPPRAEMVRLPGGSFWMGARTHDGAARSWEKPGRQVSVGPFWLDRTEVTVAAYARAVAAGAVTPPRCRVKDPAHQRFCTWGRRDTGQHPVNGVDWHQAEAYCRFRGARLPSEAEFEYALGRGAPGRVYPWGDDPTPPPGWGNLADRALPADRAEGPPLGDYGDDHRGPAPVGSYRADAAGIVDLSGNIWEWCGDWFGEDAYAALPTRDPRGPQSGARKILKGGNFYCVLEELRVSERHHKPPDDGAVFSGFRCARDPE